MMIFAKPKNVLAIPPLLYLNHIIHIQSPKMTSYSTLSHCCHMTFSAFAELGGRGDASGPQAASSTPLSYRKEAYCITDTNYKHHKDKGPINSLPYLLLLVLEVAIFCEAFF